MHTTVQVFNPRLPINSLEAYIHYVNQIPLLTHTEEYDLADQLRHNTTLSPAKKLIIRSSLILPHLRYVIRVAKNYLGYGLPLADLIQEGTVGLVKAVERFNPAMGTRLVTFAIHWIKAEIHEFILRNWRIVKVATTKAQRKLFFNLRGMKKRLSWLTTQEIKEIAHDLSVKPEVVREMETRLLNEDASLEGSQDSYHAQGTAYGVLAGFLEDQRSNPAILMEQEDWYGKYYHHLQTALLSLDERSQTIIRARWLNAVKMTLQELAQQFELSLERIRQLEKSALFKLRKALDRLIQRVN